MGFTTSQIVRADAAVAADELRALAQGAAHQLDARVAVDASVLHAFALPMQLRRRGARVAETRELVHERSRLTRGHPRGPRRGESCRRQCDRGLWRRLRRRKDFIVMPAGLQTGLLVCTAREESFALARQEDRCERRRRLHRLVQREG